MLFSSGLAVAPGVHQADRPSWLVTAWKIFSGRSGYDELGDGCLAFVMVLINLCLELP